MRSRFALCVVAVVTAACNAAPVQQTDVAAVIVNPDDASRAELEQVVSTALNGADITLADDALTHSSVLTIEHNPRQTMEQRPLLGRDLGSPEQFDLVLDGRQCTLVHRRTGLRWLLRATECMAE